MIIKKEEKIKRHRPVQELRDRRRKPTTRLSHPLVYNPEQVNRQISVQ